MLQYRRGNRKILADYKTEDIYSYYAEKYGKEAKSKATFMKILKRGYPEIINFIIYENMELTLPSRLGDLRIKKRITQPEIDEDGNLDVRKLSINWKKTKEYWEELYGGKTAEEVKKIKDKPLVRELNKHTDGYRFLWYWDRLTSNVPNQIAYSLDMTREHDRKLSKAAKTIKNLDYFE